MKTMTNPLQAALSVSISTMASITPSTCSIVETYYCLGTCTVKEAVLHQGIISRNHAQGIVNRLRNAAAVPGHLYSTYQIV